MGSDANQKNTLFFFIHFFLKKYIVQKNWFKFFFLQFKERKRYFITLEGLFYYSYYILHNTCCKKLYEMYVY